MLSNKFRGALVGLAIGDALGAPLEFKKRGSFTPVVDMQSGGVFNLPAGYWTDDTSMALCLAESLIEKQGFDAVDQMQRYCKWRDEGYLSSTGQCFDIGIATSLALTDFKKTGNPFSGSTDPRKAGNGCLMRLAPVALFYHDDIAQAIHFAGESARTTHGCLECIEACQLFSVLLVKALSATTKQEIFEHLTELSFKSHTICEIANKSYLEKSRDEIKGSGYVVESLEAALWCFCHTNNFEEAVLAAVNLGDDADTTGAICGQLAGAFYGEESIAQNWLNTLHLRDMIAWFAESLCKVKRIKS